MQLHFKNKKLPILIGLFLILVIIVLPTGTPEDFITTVPIIGIFGWKIYVIVALILVIGLLIIMSNLKENK